MLFSVLQSKYGNIQNLEFYTSLSVVLNLGETLSIFVGLTEIRAASQM